VKLDVPQDPGSKLGPGMSAFRQGLISNNSREHDERGDNPGQEKEGSTSVLLYKLWLLLTSWVSVSRLLAAPEWLRLKGIKGIQHQSGLSQTVGHIWRGAL